MRASADPAAVRALEALERLEREHDEAEAHHAAVDTLVRRWLDDDGLSSEDTDALREHLAHLSALYERHIELEDKEVFPAVARALDRGQIAEIGREMAARRQLHTPIDALLAPAHSPPASS